MAKSLAVAGAVLVLAGGGVLGYALTRKAHGAMTTAQTQAMSSAVGELENGITKARSELRGGADALARTTAVRAAVVTDPQTVKDQVEQGKELKFSPSEGITIELGQVIGGVVTPLSIQPANGTIRPKHHAPGSYTDLDGVSLAMTEVVNVEPSSDAVRDGKPIVGYIASSRALDLAPMIGKLEAAGIHGKLVNEGKSHVIGKPEPGAKTEARTLPSQSTFQIVVDVPGMRAATPKGLTGAGAGAAALGLLLVAASMLRKKDAGAGAVNLPESSLATAATKLSAAYATPVDGHGQTLLNPGEIGPGAVIGGRWEVIRRLGSGGMADVYLAHSKGEAGFEKLVAIKVMHPHLARNQRAVDHFLDEAKLAARIHHPNVVQIQDLGKIGNDYVIVMDYVEGVDLERLLTSARNGGRLVPVDVALGILRRICDGLDAAHRATAADGSPLDLIHRDVKTANVLVSRQGGVKVVDFGIAKAATQGHLTVAGETKGTPSYMAPEQRVGEQVDVRADVYSVGAVAYEILTGHAVNLDLAALAHLGVENWPHLPPPSSLRTQLPPELDGIVLTAMAFERERRPASCADFEAVFERVMKGTGLSCSDKDIARWVEGELRHLVPAFQGASSTAISRPV